MIKSIGEGWKEIGNSGKANNQEEEEEVKKEKPGVREWIKEDNDKMGNMVNPYYKL